MAYGFSSKPDIAKLAVQPKGFAPKRSVVVDIEDVLKAHPFPVPDRDVELLERFDLVYRTLCGILYNYVPTSGHPGGSISSGRHTQGVVYFAADYDFSDPNGRTADIISYAAGHKAMGLYAMWALRNEVARIAAPQLLPEPRLQLRLEDLLGFRRNPTQETPLFKKHAAKPLDGHPTPFTPFVRLSTGASGVGVGSSFGLALGAMDIYRDDPPRVHVMEGEGGLTPGRVQEAFAGAASASLRNIVMHLDWNQASIDSNRVCREGGEPGDYVQWDPVELGWFHDWNVILVRDGMNFRKVLAAQRLALQLDTTQPTLVVYRTVKGWSYGIEGRKSHGAGHKFCSEEFYKYCAPFEQAFGVTLPVFTCAPTPAAVEESFFDVLMAVRRVLEGEKEATALLAGGLVAAKKRLEGRARRPAAGAPALGKIYEKGALDPMKVPAELLPKPGAQVTVRGELGNVLNYVNKLSGGAILVSAADLLGSTSVDVIGKGFPEGFYNAARNPGCRLVAVGGICEDAMGAFMSGLAAFGGHIGVSSSYGAFIAALEHIAARLHCIGQQTKRECVDEPYNAWFIVNAHAGVKTGEDGPTHADPQCLQLLQDNFPRGTCVTLTPWDPAEMWPLVVGALLARPAVISPYVTRPGETVPDRAKLGLPDVTAAVTGVYALRRADPGAARYNGTVVLQGSEVAFAFVGGVLPKIVEKGLNMNVYYVASAELFDLLPEAEQERIFPAAHAAHAMGITGFTLPTMYRWVVSPEGRRRTLHPFRAGRFLGSGASHKVMEEAGLDGAGQWKEVETYADEIERRHRAAPASLACR